MAQLGLAAASCVARCEQLPKCTAQGNKQLELQSSKSLWKKGRVHGPEKLCLGFIGFLEVQGPLKIYIKSCVFTQCSGGRRRGEYSFHHILKEGLIPEMVKNPGAYPLFSLLPPSLDWGSLPTTSEAYPNAGPNFLVSGCER